LTTNSKERGQNFEFFFFNKWKNHCQLTPKVPRPISYQETLKTTMFVAFAQENKKRFVFLESNHRILYLTYLRSCGKYFMKFGLIDLKIWAFKSWKKSFLALWSLISNDFDHHLWKILCIEELSWESRKKIHQKNTWFSFLKKLLSRSRSKIERKN